MGRVAARARWPSVCGAGELGVASGLAAAAARPGARACGTRDALVPPLREEKTIVLGLSRAVEP